MVDKKNMIYLLLSFVLGLLLGNFLSLTILREAVPLRNHIYMIGFASISIIPIFIFLVVWYYQILRSLEKLIGSKGGHLIGIILAFIVVTNILIFVTVSAIFFAAVA